MDLKKVVFIWKHLVSWSQIGGSFLELKFWEEGNECKRAPFSATSPNGRACPRCLFFDFSQHFTLEKYQKNPHFLILEFRDQLTEYENNFFLSLCNFNVQGSHNQFCKRLCSTHTGLISWNKVRSVNKVPPLSGILKGNVCGYLKIWCDSLFTKFTLLCKLIKQHLY